MGQNNPWKPLFFCAPNRETRWRLPPRAPESAPTARWRPRYAQGAKAHNSPGGGAEGTTDRGLRVQKVSLGVFLVFFGQSWLLLLYVNLSYCSSCFGFGCSCCCFCCCCRLRLLFASLDTETNTFYTCIVGVYIYYMYVCVHYLLVQCKQS